MSQRQTKSPWGEGTHLCTTPIHTCVPKTLCLHLRDLLQRKLHQSSTTGKKINKSEFLSCLLLSHLHFTFFIFHSFILHHRSADMENLLSTLVAKGARVSLQASHPDKPCNSPLSSMLPVEYWMFLNSYLDH